MKLATLLLGALMPAISCAGDYRAEASFERPLDFTLSVGQTRTDLVYDTRHIDTTTKRVGIILRERFNERLWLNMHGGRVAVTQTGSALTAGRELSGYYAGLGFDLTLVPGNRTELLLSARYTYQNVDDQGVQSVETTWSEATTELGVRVALVDGLGAYAGLNYGAINGTERASGTVNQTLDFEREYRSGVTAALELSLGADDYINVAVRNGYARDASIYFGHRF